MEEGTERGQSGLKNIKRVGLNKCRGKEQNGKRETNGTNT